MSRANKRGNEARDKLVELGQKPSKETKDEANKRMRESRKNHSSDETPTVRVEESKHDKSDEMSKYDMFTGESANDYFERIYEKETHVEIFLEWLLFMKRLPAFENMAIKEIKDEVKQNLKIDEIERNISFHEMHFNTKDTTHTPVLDALGAKLGYSLNIISPPTKECLLCGKCLVNRHAGRPSTLTALFSLTGPKIATKLTWTCRNCKNGWKLDGNLHGPIENISYFPDRFGNTQRGFKFYPKYFQIKIIEGTGESYFEKNVVSGYWEEFSHGWLTSETKCEAYNMSHNKTEHVKSIERFMAMNPSKGNHFNKVKVVEAQESEDDEDDTKIEDEKVSRIFEMKRKALSNAQRHFCVLEELEERKLLNKVEDGELFGPFGQGEDKVTFRQSVDELMERVDIWRKEELYPHKECLEACAKRGCAKLSVADGLWKLSYPICMFDNSSIYPKDIREYLPQDCTNSPASGKAFCKEHSSQIELLDIPTGLREFLKYCGADSDAYNKDEKEKVKVKLAEIAARLNNLEVTGSSSAEIQGVEKILRSKDIANKANFQENINLGSEDCRKDIGEPTKLRRRNRGILAFISGGGIIRSWDPLYKSEGPTQVALLMLKYLMKILKGVEPEQWHKYFLSYDNMCHVDSLKLLRNSLALEEPFSTVWLDINKVIDPLHIKKIPHTGDTNSLDRCG